MAQHQRTTRSLLLGATALIGALALSTGSAAAQQREYSFNLPAQPLDVALRTYARTAEQQVIFAGRDVLGRTSSPVNGSYSAEEALQIMLAGSDLTVQRTAEGVLQVARASEGPQGGSAAGDGAEVEALIVTAQKREENIQDVPIAISAFTQEALEQQKIEGGFDLLKAIPNVTFSKNNFTSYNFSIRGIGTKAVSATTDPGVAVSFNNIALLQNRLFEQEYFDVERVEVLRGPQGTLYGRNATAGVINVISAKPDMDEFKGWIKGEVGNYHTKRLSAMVNVPLVEDKLAVRLAGSLTDRQGYDFNTGTNHAVNGRDLWSGRLTIGFNPTERIRSNLVWERFNEDDNRSRTGKQLCHHDYGPSKIGDTPTYDPSAEFFDPVYTPTVRLGEFSQGCKPGSLYEDSAFGTPNGIALPFIFGMIGLGSKLFPIGYDEHGPKTLIDLKDPYGGQMQSRDLRSIDSFRDPIYRAKADVVELNVEFDLTDDLTFASQTAYNKDSTYSFQDYNRFNTVPLFTDTASLAPTHPTLTVDENGRNIWWYLAPGGTLCDPQLGCSKSIAGFDIAQAKGEQFSQEIRLQSSFDGGLNFSVGANYTRFRTLVDYYVFYNLITALAQMDPFPFGRAADGSIDTSICNLTLGPVMSHPEGVPTATTPNAGCIYIDPNPIESIDGNGHNYFRSKNPYKLKSWAAFGELYWQATDTLKITVGLRYTDDEKRFIPVPSQVLLAPGIAGGVVNAGYPEDPPIDQHWGEWTGRLGIDWKPTLSLTDQTMLYAFYSRGYKGGGANPPLPDFATPNETQAQVGWPDAVRDFLILQGVLPIIRLNGAEYGPTFKPEFVNAFEVGAKNTLLGGALTLNGDAFFYDYKDYQVSQIRDRSAINENFDARVWGLELQTVFSPSRNLQVIGNIGYLDTRIGDGETSIDIMNRTQGDPRYALMKPWFQQTSNCIAPLSVLEPWLAENNTGTSAGGTGVSWWQFCGGGGSLNGTVQPVIDPATGQRYDPLAVGPDGKLLYPEINGGAGIRAQLGGNELPNSPHWTANIGAQYGFDFLEGWRATVRGDAYWQSQSWARVYNSDPYDKLHGWYNVNLSLWLENEEGLKIELYAKNLLDKTPITDAFLNSDDTGLTTNVFVLDPRLIGLSIRKEF